jgi:hypothetical protein
MKGLLGIVLALASICMVGSLSEAKAKELSRHNVTTVANANPQWRDRNGRRYYNRRRGHSVTRSRVVRYGRRLYRETFLVRYLPNGRVDTRLISRVRIS